MGSHAARWALLLAGISMYSSWRRSRGIIESTVLSVISVIFTVVFGSQVLAKLGVSLDPAIVLVTVLTVATATVMWWRTRKSRAIIGRDPFELVAICIASVPAAGALTAAFAMSSRWMGWIGWGGDFALHRHLIAALDINDTFTLGVAGTPTTWHLLAYVGAGARVPTFEQYAVLVVATLSLLLLAVLFVALPAGRGRYGRLCALVAVPLLFTTTPFFYVIAGFVTTVGSAAFVLLTLGVMLRQNDDSHLVQNVFVMAMATAVAVCMWQPQVVLVAVLYAGVLAFLVRRMRVLRERWISLAVLLLPVASVAMIILDTIRADAQGGGIAPGLHENVIILTGVCAAVATWFARESLRGPLVTVLVIGVAVAAIVNATNGEARFLYYQQKVAWSFLILSFALLARGLAGLRLRSPLHVVVALLVLGTTVWQPHLDNGFRLARSWVRQSAAPTSSFASIFVALDQANREKTPAVYFIRSGDDYIANLWVMYVLLIPSGPVDSTLQTPYDATSLCPFIANNPQGVIYTRRPQEIRAMVTNECKVDSGFRIVDLRPMA